ncbi:MAG: type II toxin-antitoxin system HicA family toxin [Bacteroidaceae bacterium]|nr:type II toxin-antitoxin system HicA family toxin [Bacteroidaceae bacterium]
MNRQKLPNIPLSDFRRFLFDMGCSRVAQGTKGRGGHEKWVRDDLLRPITLQTHVDPVSELVVRNTLATLGMTKKQFFDYYYK